jgi:hypothetical protein
MGDAERLELMGDAFSMVRFHADHGEDTRFQDTRPSFATSSATATVVGLATAGRLERGIPDF